ncbi:MAG: T9SS type A sorting domain-containing protein, partial [Bacteroidales bacterium]|nr:T9SS type A sorting domain-containing protein [Bacteroidales bacterium]
CPGTEITLTASSSNGGTISWDNGIQNGVAFTIESTTTFSAVSDNPVDCSHNITIFVLNDSELPVPDAATLADITDECSVEMPIVPTATDNCAGTIAGTTSTTFPITDQGTTTIIWTYDDGNGNIVTQEQDVIISDVTDPVPDVADLPTIYNQCTVTLTAPTATDNCAGTITATTADPTSYDVQGDYTVTWVYDDGNGNVVTQDQDVSLHDVFDPVPDVEELPALTGQCTVNIAVSPIAWDNCDGHITGTTSVWSFSGEGTYTAVWTYTDAVGNSSTQNQTIVIDDVTAPYPIVSDLPALLGECSVEAPTAPTALDNCEGEITGTSDTEFPVTESTTITWSYDDGNGNVSTQTQVVIISDDTDPVPDAATLTDAEGVCTVTVIAPTATDNCSGAITATTEDPTTYDVAGSYVVTWTYDDGNGNTVSQTQNVIVTDDTAPVPDAVSLTDLMDECSVDAPAAPTATDACAGVVTGTADVEFPITAQGTTTVTWTFDDGNGNTSTQTQDVILADITAPTGTCVDDVVSCDGTVASIALSDVSDNCGTPTVSYELSGATTASGTGDASGEVFEPGTTTVSYVVTDGVGNTNVCYFDVVYTPIGDIELAEADGIITVSAEGTYQWINCADNSEIAGETGSTFEPAETGEYAVVVSSEFCSDTSACVEVVVIDGLKQNDFSKFEFYPNPVTNRLTIELGAEYTNIKLAVVSTSGQLVMDEEMQSGHDAILDMSALTEGVYVIMISCDQGTSQAFVVKE